MKRFLLRVLLLGVLCLGILFGLSRGYLALLNTDYERSESTTLKYKFIPDDVQVACFGSSHAINAFQPVRYQRDDTFFNFGMQRESAIQDFALYQTYRDHLEQNCTVIITLSYFSLYDNTSHSLDVMKRYVDFLPVKSLPNLKTKLFRVFRVLDFSFEPVFSFLEGRTADYTVTETTTLASSMTEEELVALGEKRAQIFFNQIGDAKIDPEIDAALRRLLSDCIENGYRPVLVTTPYLDEFTRNFSESFLDQFQAECQAYADDFGIPYLDYSRDDRFAHTSKYFVDTDHLSSDGSEAFMDLFFDDLKAFYPED